jgi:hypothetical protein
LIERTEKLNNPTKTKMKRILIAAAVLAGLSTSVFAQGTIIIDNSKNSAASSTATTGGLVFTTSGGAAALEKANVGVTLLAGPNVNSMTAVTTIIGSANGGTSDFFAGTGAGQFTDPLNTTYTLTSQGVGSAAIGTFELQLWEGNFTSYAAAVAGGGYVAESIFTNPTGGGPTPTATLTGMPAMVLTTTPEPSTIALGGLGAAALLFFRRRK